MPSAPTKKTAAAPAAGTKAPRKAPAKAAGRAAGAKAAGDKPALRPAAMTPTAGATLRARDLAARVAEATGTKAKDIRATIEATLSELGKALDAGETLNLPPLGKLRITPAKAEGGDGPMKLKLRRGAGTAPKKKADKEALADAGEAS
jgi:DNA-binding protein HU-alpha